MARSEYVYYVTDARALPLNKVVGVFTVKADMIAVIANTRDRQTGQKLVEVPEIRCFRMADGLRRNFDGTHGEFVYDRMDDNAVELNKETGKPLDGSR